MKFVNNFKPAQFDEIKRAITRYFRTHPNRYNTGGKLNKLLIVPNVEGYEVLNQLLGLAYTSTGDYAGIWVCNGVDLFADDKEQFKYIGFTFDEAGNVWGVAWDKDEKELLINFTEAITAPKKRSAKIISSVQAVESSNTIKRLWSQDTGGGMIVDYVLLKSGQVLGITDESIALYKNKEEAEGGQPIQSIFLNDAPHTKELFLVKTEDGRGEMPFTIDRAGLLNSYNSSDLNIDGESLTDWLLNCEAGDIFEFCFDSDDYRTTLERIK